MRGLVRARRREMLVTAVSLLAALVAGCNVILGTLSVADGGPDVRTHDAGDNGRDTGRDTTRDGPVVDSGTCIPPEGGPPCTPGMIICGGDAACAVPRNFCCQENGSETCQSEDAACAGAATYCNEEGDCPPGQACCLAIPVSANGITSCQKLVNGACPSAMFGSAQVCRSDKECPAGKCQFWSCLFNIVESCTSPAGAACSLQSGP